MVQIILVGLGAGAAAALLFASMLSGSSLSVLLLSLAPLPIILAAVGWSHWLGLAAAALAASVLAPWFGIWFAVAFLIGTGLPAWWLGYLTLLARDRGDQGVEWYPVGHLVFWSALLGALVMAGIIVLGFGADVAGFQAALRGVLEQFARLTHALPEGGTDADWDWRLNLLVAVLPPTAAIIMTLTNVTNLWLTARILRLSGRLRRPWPDLSAMTLPRSAPPVLVFAMAASFLPGLLGVLAIVLSASLVMAYGVVGFAVLHAVTRHVGARAVLLAATYMAVFLFTWPVLIMSLLALLDAAIDLRGRVALRRPPPSIRT